MAIYWRGKGGGWTIEQELAVCPFNREDSEALANREFWEYAAGRALQLG